MFYYFAIRFSCGNAFISGPKLPEKYEEARVWNGQREDEEVVGTASVVRSRAC
jgi:hypothetical protein